MEYRISYRDEDGVMVVKAEGKMTGEGYLAMAEGILKHPRHNAGGSAIFDHTDLDFSGVGLDALETIRDFHKENEEKIGSGKTAIIVKPGMAGEWYKTWSQGKKIESGNRVEVFEDYNAAFEWIKK